MELHIQPIKIKNIPRIGITNRQFDDTYVSKIKQIEGRQWSLLFHCWHIPYTPTAWAQFQQVFENEPIINDAVKIEEPLIETTQPILQNKEILQKEGQIAQPFFEKNTDDTSQENQEGVLIARFCPGKPNLVFLLCPSNRKDWQTFINKTPGRWWHPVEKVWSIPRTKDLFKHFTDFFGEKLVIDKETPLLLEKPRADILANDSALRNPTKPHLLKSVEETPYSQIADKITVFEHPTERHYWCLNLPVLMLKTHLSILKNIHGRRWDDRLFVWNVPKSKITFRFIEKYLADDIHWACDVNEDLIEQIDPIEKRELTISNSFTYARYEAAVTALEQTLLLKRYSWRTIKVYKNCFRQFIKHYDDTKPSQLTRQQIDNYIASLIKNKNISESHQNQILSAVKMFYAEVIEQEEKVQNLIRPKKHQKLPHYFTEDEIKKLLSVCENPKHKLILTLIYSAGLRLGELVNLKIHDLIPSEHRIFVRRGKGKKDRCTILADKVIPLLMDYLEVYKPVEWLIEGQIGGPYSVRSVQCLFTDNKIKAKINPLGTVHTLRHSFATHLVDSGVALNYVQDLLGHENIETTEIYLHLTKAGKDKIRSPLDSIL
jgi:integrase/recombinase XerD